MTFSVVIVAAGAGTRAGPGQAKQWRPLAGKPVLRWSVEAFLAAGAAEIVVVTTADGEDALTHVLGGLRGWRAARGGATRALSVQAGLAALRDRPGDEPVMIHDAARPFVTRKVVDDLLQALANADLALPALAVADTLKLSSPGSPIRTVSREHLWRAQTPQVAPRRTLLAAYAAWASGEPTDDAQVVEAAGGRVAITPGDPLLTKLTYPEDFAMAERLADAARVTRVGQGFDAHRWGPGEEVWLCGVAIKHDETLIGHSDADAGLHALTDAILYFLKHAVDLVVAKGGALVNVDVTLICERPKIKPHRQAMRERLADILSLPIDRVSVKATTTEKMGFTGRGEGLAASAVVSVETPA
ncbi:MAG: 2-C-methyl-D-erythritol 4-phosphate cytidylyltransferase [Caulobacter vibrioides]|uniref:Bifunctional enzyme IspD/IspF n=1 Tax=Caulobacter vibrioides TaxID=155892 RepID=A0A258D2R0_CAUVI|nr:MAG: 2-C-methyl-D-erythritol 4-phosphate cytidylyltransferase [Caulobacter vibrioides]